MTSVREIAHDPVHGLTLLVETPLDRQNFREYNRTCGDVNSAFLSQPINEAQYDSETQACVDLLTPGGATSFYDHFVAHPEKKRYIGNAGLEEPMEKFTKETGMCGASTPRLDMDMDYLAVPKERDLPLEPCSKNLLENPISRRVATGVMPTPPNS